MVVRIVTLALLTGVLVACGSGSDVPEAADGANLSACADGRCQVAVSKPATLPFGKTLKLSTVDLRELSEDSVTVKVSDTNGQVSSSISPGCTAHVAASDGMNSVVSDCGGSVVGGQPGAHQEQGRGVMITYVGWRDDAAIVTVAPEVS